MDLDDFFFSLEFTSGRSLYVCWHAFTFLLSISSRVCPLHLNYYMWHLSRKLNCILLFSLFDCLQVCISCGSPVPHILPSHVHIPSCRVLGLQFWRALLLYQSCFALHFTIALVLKYSDLCRIAAFNCCLCKIVVIEHQDNKRQIIHR